MGALLLLLLFSLPSTAQQSQPLYPGPIPGAIDAPDEEATRDPTEAFPFRLSISRPTLTAYLPKQRDANGAAVIICQGGS